MSSLPCARCGGNEAIPDAEAASLRSAYSGGGVIT